MVVELQTRFLARPSCVPPLDRHAVLSIVEPEQVQSRVHLGIDRVTAPLE